MTDTWNDKDRYEFVAKWTAALRSGDYKQASDQLRVRSSWKNGAYHYCCLGVACDIARPDGWVGESFRWDNAAFTSNGGLPQDMRASLGFNGSLRSTDNLEHISLIDLNDRAGKTFEEIADVIDAGQVVGIPSLEVRQAYLDELQETSTPS